MRFVIFIFSLSFSLMPKANEFCSSYESLSLVSTANKLVLKCDCNCTNEENIFYININGVNSINSLEASRLISLEGISKNVFDNLKNYKILCEWQSYKKSYGSNLIFAVKVPDGNNTCFEIKEYSLSNKKKSNHPIYYLINETNSFNLVNVSKIDSSLGYFGVNELSNKLLNKGDRSKLLLNKGDVVKSEYSLEGKSVVRKGDVFLEIDNNYLDPYFDMRLKSYLYSKPDITYKSNMYLIKGDRIRVMDEYINNGVLWYFINYKGKKEINMWIKADSIDLN
ncbi:hypothetical protein HYE54_00100 [Aggregatibacter actinomycetemcomitans]|uniref:hypothetical protein n=1 Tax=Aggregatibacter actinomycetemcomitans TaxID=714 RepID=UPI00197C683A|nr:hypothetical protein [Aggregatibacter actinomycetemcomitans]MBN6067231.1 hypothetical protein [Aggregatibacter actinomycetemcomitans]MBN6086472.1 hypothetical protein [Aggregatibacter actinomycetemcomitans]